MVEVWGPTLTLSVRSVKKSLIQRQVECSISMSDSLSTSLWGRMVLKAMKGEEQLSIAPLLLQVGQCSMEGCGHSVLSRSFSPVSELMWIKGGGG